jgi:flagella basal body P-ring formation protein FlgA
LHELSCESDIPVARLAALLQADAVREQSRHRRFWQHAWLDLVVGVFLIAVIIGLGAALMGGDAHFIWVAKANLPAGRDLRSIDVERRSVRTDGNELYLIADSIEGFHLVRAVPAGATIRTDDVFRWQVVTRVPIKNSQLIAAGDVELRLTPYRAQALLRTEDAAGRVAQSDVAADQVLRRESLGQPAS